MAVMPHLPKAAYLPYLERWLLNGAVMAFVSTPSLLVRVLTPKEFAECISSPARVSLKHQKTALGRFCKKFDIANAAEYLGSNLANYETGDNLVVDGGRWLK